MTDQEETDRYQLFEIDYLEKLCQPIQGSTRVKYTCIDASDNKVVLGANSGSLYLFQRYPLLSYIKVVTSKEGPVTTIKISPNEKYVAVATNKGIVSIVQLEAPSKYLHVSKDHKGFVVTCLCWRSCSSNLYIGDDRGKVTSINITLKKAHSLFNASTALIVQLGCKVVQLDIYENRILVSCLNATFLCDIIKEKYSKIGTKLRDGPFGSCFYKGKIYCARPGQRLWEVDLKGRVLFTHQLKQALSKPSTPVIIDGDHCDYFSIKSNSCSPSVHFNLLLVVCNRFIVTWGNRYLFVFDPHTNSLILWSSFESEIKNVRVVGCEVFLHFFEGNFKHLYLLSILDGIDKLIKNCQWKIAANLCNLYKDKLYLPNCKIQKNHVQLLLGNLNNEEPIFNVVSEIIKKLEELYPPEEVNANTKGYKVESGIFVVNRPENVTSPKKIDYSPRSPVPKCETDDERVSAVLMDPFVIDPHHMGMVMPFMPSQFLDPDIASLGFDAISVLKPNVSFDDLKSKYYTGKDKILTRIGQLEDRIKGANASHNRLPFDVRTLDAIESTDDHNEINESKTPTKTVEKQMPLHLQNMLDVCHDILAKLPTATHDRKKYMLLLDHWTRVLNTTLCNHYKYSQFRGESKIQRSNSCDNLTVLMEINRRQSFPLIRKDDTWLGRSFEDFYLYETLYNHKEKSAVFDWLQKWHTFHYSEEDISKLSRLTSLCFTNRVFGQISDNAELSSESELEDYSCSIFISIYFNFLNPHVVRQELERDLEKIFKKSWTSLVSSLMDSDLHSEEFNPLIQCYKLILKYKCSKNKKDLDLLSELVDYLVTNALHVTPRDVYYLDEHAELHGNLLMCFMDEAYEKHFFKACDDSFVSEIWIKAALAGKVGHEKLACKCGTPKAGSHKRQWKRSDILNQIIRNANIKKDMRETFKVYEYWYGYMYECNRLQFKSEVMKTLVHLSDIDLFRDPFNAALLPPTNDEWNLVFQLTNNLNRECQTCNEDLRCDSWPLLTVESVVDIALDYVQPNVVVNFLSALSPQPRITSRTFRKLVAGTIQKTRQKAMYPGINYFVWSQSRAYASAEIRNDLLSEAFKTRNIPMITSKNEKCDWGVSLDLKSLCFRCHLPLIVPLNENASGIRIFSCGHGFHISCMVSDDSVCSKCKTTSQNN